MHVCPLTPLHIEGKVNDIANMPSRLFGSNPAWTCVSDTDLLNLFNTLFSFTATEILDSLPPKLRGSYARDFRLADEAFCAGQLEVTSNKRGMRWRNWCTYVKHLGVDLYLQQFPYSKQF